VGRVRNGAWVAVALLVSTVGGTAAGAQVRQGVMSLEDARIAYEVLGAGDPIFVVHGGPGLDHAYLRPGLDALGSHAEVVYWDQRGTGDSEAMLDSTTISWDAFLGDMDRLRQMLGYERVAVLGHSFGGLLALDYARRYPEHTRAVILLNSTEPGRRWADETRAALRNARTSADSVRMAELAVSEGFGARDPATMSAYYRTAFRASMRHPDRVAELELDLAPRTARNGPDVARLLGGSLGPVDWWSWLETLDAPLLVLHGRYDAIPEEMARTLAETVPHGRYVALEGGHFPWLGDAPGMVAAISTFLAGLDR